MFSLCLIVKYYHQTDIKTHRNALQRVYAVAFFVGRVVKTRSTCGIYLCNMMKRRKNVVLRLLQREYAIKGHLRKNLAIMRCLVCQVFLQFTWVKVN